ncbi:hypothetical protein [Plantactinospora sp. WMMB782]|uniref:hypothetical protein n=1 Tax=Plantactinospora sp. WMMB782 TaxID=3404121 RepID=UPI003B960B89
MYLREPAQTNTCDGWLLPGDEVYVMEARPGSVLIRRAGSNDYAWVDPGALESAPKDGVAELEARVARLEERLQRVLEVSDLWDGS